MGGVSRGYEDLVERGPQGEFGGHAELEKVEELVGKAGQVGRDGVVDHALDVLVEMADREGVGALHQHVQRHRRRPDIRGEAGDVEALPVLGQHELLLPGEVQPQPAEGVVLEAREEGQSAQFDFAASDRSPTTHPDEFSSTLSGRMSRWQSWLVCTREKGKRGTHGRGSCGTRAT